MKNIQHKTIAIVGGGPGGLTLARILQMNGAAVKVYERDINRQARVQGATLDLHDDAGLKALREAGLFEAFKANYRPGADVMCIVDNNGHVVLEEHAVAGDMSRPEIDRGPLREILLDSLHPGTVVWNSRFSSLTPQGEGWLLHFQDAVTAYADIVIGADGANSKIRPYITDIKPFYSGVTGLEGAVYNAAVNAPGISKLLNGGKIFAMGNNQCLIVSSKGDGSLVFYPSFNADASWYRECGIDFSDRALVFAWFKETYAGWDNSWYELFEHAEPQFICRPLYCMPLDQTWEALPNLTILGDAAHLMPPFAGEGVNMAMLDALELGQCLTSDEFPDVHAAIAAYETQMRARAAESAGMTMVSTAALHGPDAIPFLLEVIGQ